MTAAEEKAWLEQIQLRLFAILKETNDELVVREIGGPLQAIAEILNTRSKQRKLSMKWALSNFPAKTVEEQIASAEAYFEFLRG